MKQFIAMKKFIAAGSALALTLSLAACGSPAPASSGGAPAVPAIGVIQLVQHPSLNEIYDAFADELKVLGYDESKVRIDYQNGQGEAGIINSACQKFVGDQVDLIVAIATPAAQSAAAATADIPIVFSAVTDPVGAGLVGEGMLGTPDANSTGTSDAIPTDRIFDLADELTPGIKTYGFVYNNGETNSVTVIAEAKQVLESRGVAYVEATVTGSGEVTTAVQSLVGKVDAIFVPIDNTVATAMPNLSQIAIDAKLPVYVAADSLVADGGLGTVGVNYTQLGRQTARMAVKALEGAPIGQIPVEVLDEFSVTVNAETAAALGVDVSKIGRAHV